MSEKIIALAKKLKALSDRGIGGEKENAAQMLQSLMEKHGITAAMIEGVEIKEHEFVTDKHNTLEHRFFIQIIANVCGENAFYGEFKYSPRNIQRWYVKCTVAEAIEIQAKKDFYYKILTDEIDIFYSAFIQKNQLYLKEDESSQNESKELTPEEMARIEKMLKHMKSMDKHNFTKQIGYSNKK